MINDTLVVLLAAQAVTAAMPFVIAGIGELCAQRTGTLNVGIEGLLLAGCIGGFAGAAMSGHAWIGIVTAISAAGFLAAIFAWATVYMRTDQIVTGMAINLLAVGGSGTAWLLLQTHGYAELANGVGITRGIIPGLSSDLERTLFDLPIVGPLLFHQYGLLLGAVVIIGCSWWMMRATRLGIILSALGDNPDACQKMGIAVRRWRFCIIICAGMLAGIAGAYLSLMRVHGFAALMTGGMGFVILALVIFARWHIGWLVLVCLGFGAVDALQSVLQSRGYNDVVPYQIFQALPFIVALVALGCLRQRSTGPRTLGQSWPANGYGS